MKNTIRHQLTELRYPKGLDRDPMHPSASSHG
jgi:hypothetical protein